MKSLILFLLKIYIKTEPLRHQFYTSIGINPHACRFDPSCSRYTIKSIKQYGTIQGIRLALKQLSRCWGKN